MKRRGFAITSALLFMVVVAGAQEGPAGPSEEEMAAMMKAISPGQHHQYLAAFVGSWQATVKMWNDPQQVEPEVSTGSAEMTMILDGRYLRQEVTSTFYGMPFSGLGFTGFDNSANQYISVWMDTMGTGIMVDKGTCDEEGKVFTFHGTFVDPMTGAEIKSRSEYTITGPDSHQVVMYVTTPEGREYKGMEIFYTRR